MKMPETSDNNSCTWVAAAVFAIIILLLLWLHFNVVSPWLVRYFRRMQNEEISARLLAQESENARLQALSKAAALKMQEQTSRPANNNAQSKPKKPSPKPQKAAAKQTPIISKQVLVQGGKDVKKVATVVKQDAKKFAADTKKGLAKVGQKLKIKKK